MAQVDVIDNLATDPFGVPTMNGHQEEVKAQEDVMTNFGPIAFFFIVSIHD